MGKNLPFNGINTTWWRTWGRGGGVNKQWLGSNSVPPCSDPDALTIPPRHPDWKKFSLTAVLKQSTDQFSLKLRKFWPGLILSQFDTVNGHEFWHGQWSQFSKSVMKIFSYLSNFLNFLRGAVQKHQYKNNGKSLHAKSLSKIPQILKAMHSSS